jgi:hypothetical protein
VQATWKEANHHLLLCEEVGNVYMRIRLAICQELELASLAPTKGSELLVMAFLLLLFFREGHSCFRSVLWSWNQLSKTSKNTDRESEGYNLRMMKGTGIEQDGVSDGNCPLPMREHHSVLNTD